MTCREKKFRNKIKDNQLHPNDQWFHIGTGNYYKGKWNHRTMSGYGVYAMQNGNQAHYYDL